LGAQVNVRSSIIGEGGRAKEAQTEFLTLMESAIRQLDLAKSVQRYQLAESESQPQPGRGPHGVANAGEHDHKHGKHGRPQQQTQTGGFEDEAGRKQ